MSEAEWEAYTGISSEEMRRKIERLTPIRIGKVFSLSRRAAVALTIVVVFTLFMACTPIGRAWVVAAYNAIVEVADGILYIRTDEEADISRDEPTIESIEDTITYFDSVSDAAEQIDEPILCFQNDVAELVSMRKVISPVKGLVVESEYSLSDHINITIKQEWGNSHVGSIVTDDTKAHVRIVLPDGLIIDGVYANDDMSFVGVAVTGETIIHVCIMNIPSTDKIQEVLSLTEIR